jgi:hypothetical protein
MTFIEKISIFSTYIVFCIFLIRRIYFNTKNDVPYINQNRDYVLNILLEWCNKHVKPHDLDKNVPKIIISNHSKGEVLGEFDYVNNEIKLYIKRHKSTVSFINSFIHEYVHFVQFQTESDLIRYRAITKKKTYWENEYEVEARAIANKFTNKCYLFLSDKLV